MKISNPIFLTTSLLLHDLSSGFTPSIAPLAARQVVSTSRSFAALKVGKSVDDKKTTSRTEDSVGGAFEDTESKFLGQPIPYSELTIGVLKETFKGENRVSQVRKSTTFANDESSCQLIFGPQY